MSEPLLELRASSNGSPPGVGGMSTASPTMWIRALGRWYRVDAERSQHKLIKLILEACEAVPFDGGDRGSEGE